MTLVDETPEIVLIPAPHAVTPLTSQIPAPGQYFCWRSGDAAQTEHALG